MHITLSVKMCGKPTPRPRRLDHATIDVTMQGTMQGAGGPLVGIGVDGMGDVEHDVSSHSVQSSSDPNLCGTIFQITIDRKSFVLIVMMFHNDGLPKHVERLTLALRALLTEAKELFPTIDEKNHFVVGHMGLRTKVDCFKASVWTMQLSNASVFKLFNFIGCTQKPELQCDSHDCLGITAISSHLQLQATPVASPLLQYCDGVVIAFKVV